MRDLFLILSRELYIAKATTLDAAAFFLIWLTYVGVKSLFFKIFSDDKSG